MHPCLAIPDLQSRIFEHFPTVHRITLEPESDSMRTLAHLARTCRAFTEPALTVLWRNQATLGPLVEVMPCRILGRKSGQRKVRFIRPPGDADWARFEYYARKIRAFGSYHHKHSLPIHNEVMMMLASYRPARCILPNLREITLQMSDSEDELSLLFAQCLLSSTIQHVWLIIDEERHASPTLISAIRRNCPNIQQLSLKLSAPRHSTVVLALNDLMCTLPRLQTLIAPLPIPMDTLLHLSMLPSLGTLHMEGIVFNGSQTIELLASQDNCFARLHSLLFSVSSLEEPTLVMNAVHRPLSKLGVQLSQIPASIQANNFITAITRHPCRNSLRHLNISTNPPILDTEHSDDITNIHALFLLPGIESLELNCRPFAAAVDDAWLATAAATWPRLSTLMIHSKTKSTLAGLMPLVRRCPLEYISISAVWAPFNLRCLDPVVGNTLVESILMFKSTIEGDVLAVLRCLLAMFPRLTRVSQTGGREGATRWAELQRSLDRSLQC
ncbi:hypothetical protein FPV67DRAFT_872971 [Lyophyllum atratum]|nr:hypothetical protein FPV67DRAFT_872971 [Lyophyllum atratum]